jgi:hypothetical protein
VRPTDSAYQKKTEQNGRQTQRFFFVSAEMSNVISGSN